MKIRIHKDITVRWRVKTAGQAVALTGRDLAVIITDPTGRKKSVAYAVTDTNLITFCFYGKDQTQLGKHTATLLENAGREQSTAVDSVDFVTLVRYTTMEETSNQDNLTVSTINLSGDLTTNCRGASAYEIWLANGHTGTEADFITWLQQPATTAAASATSAASAATSAAAAATAATTAAGTATDDTRAATTQARSATTQARNAATAAERVNATIAGTVLTVTDRDGNSTSVDTKGEPGRDGQDGAPGADGAPGTPGPQGPQGPAGSDASVTSQNIASALGYTPASSSDVTALDAKIGNLEKGVRVNIITDGTNRVVLPNFDIAAKTLSIGGDVGVEICGTHYGVRNLVVNMRPAASTAFKLWFDTSSKTFVATLFGTTPLSTYVLVGAYRWSNDGSIYLDFPFEVTFNGDINTRGRYYSPSVTPWTSKAYVDGLVGDINTILTAIVG